MVDPYDRDGRVITVPATGAHRAYAEGRHRHVHDLAVSNARRMVKGEFDFEALMRALDLLGDAAAAARAKPERKAIHRGLARFLDGERKKRFRSEVRTGTPALSATTAGHLDPLAIARRPKATVSALLAPEPSPPPWSEPPRPVARARRPWCRRMTVRRHSQLRPWRSRGRACRLSSRQRQRGHPLSLRRPSRPRTTSTMNSRPSGPPRTGGREMSKPHRDDETPAAPSARLSQRKSVSSS